MYVLYAFVSNEKGREGEREMGRERDRKKNKLMR